RAYKDYTYQSFYREEQQTNDVKDKRGHRHIEKLSLCYLISEPISQRGHSSQEKGKQQKQHPAVVFEPQNGYPCKYPAENAGGCDDEEFAAEKVLHDGV